MHTSVSFLKNSCKMQRITVERDVPAAGTLLELSVLCCDIGCLILTWAFIMSYMRTDGEIEIFK